MNWIEYFDEQNPIRVVRMQQGLSYRVAAAKIDCHYQTLYMNEQGMFSTVLPRVTKWIMGVVDISKADLDAAYNAFVSARRRQNGPIYGMDELAIDVLGIPGQNPVTELRHYLEVSQARFCKLFCVPQALMYEAETRAKSLSITLRAILEELKVPDTVIQEMADRYEAME